MKKFFFIFLLIGIISCGSTDDGNPILPNIPVNVTLNLNLPSYQSLKFNNGTAFIANHGIKGIIVFRISQSNILAWDAACPHLAPSECAAMTLNGLEIICTCDNSEFNIINGAPLSGTQYSMKQYRAVYNTNETIIITNF